MKERIDRLMVERGLAESRARAQAMIIAGQVLADEVRIDKPGHVVSSEAQIRIKGGTCRYVSRAGVKLERALLEWKIDPLGKTCIDLGASTGGFTDCLLQHGAERVWAIDVGHNQLAWSLRQDSRVTVLECLNARYLDSESFEIRFDLATIDVSFISLDKILPAVAQQVGPNSDIIALIKPQFEVGKGEVGRRGIVKDQEKHRQVLRRITEFAANINLPAIDFMLSPILGAEGNREFLGHFSAQQSRAAAPERIEDRIRLLTC